MKLDELVTTATDAITVRRVFAEPYERDDVTIIPAAAVTGGGGGGSGHEAQGDQGEGGGFGLSARPAGAYIIRGGKVRWRPAIDINRIVVTAGVVAVAYLFTRLRIERVRANANR